MVLVLSSSGAAATAERSGIEADQHNSINLTVFATGDEVTDGEEFRKTRNPEIEIEVAASEEIQDVVIRVNGERRRAYHPNKTVFNKSVTVSTLNTWNDIEIVVRTRTDTVKQIHFRWLKDTLPPQLISANGGMSEVDVRENDDSDDPFANVFVSSSPTIISNNSYATITGTFADQSPVRQIKITRTYNISYAGDTKRFKKIYHISRINNSDLDNIKFEQRIFVAPSLGGELVENDVDVNVWDEIGNHKRYDYDVRVDDDRSPNATQPLTSGFVLSNVDGPRRFDLYCTDIDDRFNNTSGTYYGGVYDDVTDCGEINTTSDSTQSDNTSTPTLNWLTNRSDHEVAEANDRHVNVVGSVEDEVAIRSVEYRVRYLNITHGPFCSEISDSLDQLERSDFDDSFGSPYSTGADDLDYGNLTCSDLTTGLLIRLDQDDFENVSDEQWNRFQEEQELTEYKDFSFISSSQTGRTGPQYRQMSIDQNVLLKNAPDHRVLNIINITVTDWAGHETHISKPVKSYRLRIDPLIKFNVSTGKRPFTINVTGTVSKGEVNAVSIESVDDRSGEILSHVDVYDGNNTRRTIMINEILPRAEGPTTIIIRANDSEGETHVERLGLKEQTEGGQVVTRTPTPTPTPGSPTPAGTTDTPTPSPTSGPETPTPEETPSPTRGSTPVPGIAGDITALAGPGFGALGAVLALIATLVLLSRRQD